MCFTVSSVQGRSLSLISTPIAMGIDLALELDFWSGCDAQFRLHFGRQIRGLNLTQLRFARLSS